MAGPDSQDVVIEESEPAGAAQPTTDAIDLSAIRDALDVDGTSGTPTAADNSIAPLIVMTGIGAATAAAFAVHLPRLSALVVAGLAVVAAGAVLWWARRRCLAGKAAVASASSRHARDRTGADERRQHHAAAEQ